MNLIEDLYTRVDGLGINFVQLGYQKLVDMVSEPLQYAIVITLGIAIAAAYEGRILLNGELFKKIVLIVAVLEFALVWGSFAHWVMDTMAQTQNEVSGALLEAAGADPSSTTGGAISVTFNKMFSGTNLLLSKGFTWPWDGAAILSAIILFFGSLVLFGADMCISLSSKVADYLLLPFAPVFISLALYARTFSIFWGWLMSVLTFFFIPILCTAVLAFALSVLGPTIALAEAGNLNLLDAAVISLVCCVLGFFIWLMPSVAGSIFHSGAGFGITRMGSVFMGPVSAAGAQIGGAVTRGAAHYAGVGGAAAARAIGRAGVALGGRRTSLTNSLRAYAGQRRR